MTETSVELLEIMKRRKVWAENSNERIVTIDKEHFDWLIEQAERAQVMESNIHELREHDKNRTTYVARLSKEIQQLREEDDDE